MCGGKRHARHEFIFIILRPWRRPSRVEIFFLQDIYTDFFCAASRDFGKGRCVRQSMRGFRVQSVPSSWGKCLMGCPTPTPPTLPVAFDHSTSKNVPFPLIRHLSGHSTEGGDFIFFSRIGFAEYIYLLRRQKGFIRTWKIKREKNLF